MLTFSELYDHKFLFKCLLWIGMLIVLSHVTLGWIVLLLFPLILHGLLARKTETLFFWLLVLVCSVIANGYVVRKTVVFAIAQRGFMVLLGGVLSLQMLQSSCHAILRPFRLMAVYVLYMSMTAGLGWCPIVSYLKLFLFTVIYFSYVAVANQVGNNRGVSTRKIRSVMLTVAIFMVLGSVALVPFPGISQMKADEILMHGGSLEDLQNMTSLFCGMANHSQCLGPVISSIGVIVFADLLFSVKKWDSLYLVLIVCCPYLIYLTSSRTGMGAYLLGIGFVGFLFMQSRGIGRRWKNKVISLSMVGSVCLFAFVACSSGVQQGIAKFALKFGSEGEELSTERFLRSRMGKFEEGIENFKESPLFGNGFQVSRSMKGQSLGRGGTSIFSAPIEKGVWIAAILEEGGIIGGVIFTSVLLICIFGSVRKRAYIGASCLFVITLTNLGEFTFFSMSYSGGFTWAMVFAGLALDIRRIKDERGRPVMFAGARAIPRGGTW